MGEGERKRERKREGGRGEEKEVENEYIGAEMRNKATFFKFLAPSAHC